MNPRVIATISQEALLHNFQVVKSLATNSKILAMVKANGYGHGLTFVAKTLKGADAFGVANVDEAFQLRRAGIDHEIVLMEGFLHAHELSIIQQEQLTQVVHLFEQIAVLEQLKSKKILPVWIKINTGMNRLGFRLEDFPTAYQRLKAIPWVRIVGFMTHFPQADERHNPLTMQQCETFLRYVEALPGAKSLANSAAILSLPKTHQDWVRPGLILYGASPFEDHTRDDFNLKPAMRLSSKIISIQHLNPGERVGYGGRWEAKNPHTKIGIIAIGYGDGYPWHAESLGTPVLVNQHRCKLIGRVSMDMIAIDLSQLSEVKLGDTVELWGAQLPIEEVAKAAKTIPYELFCRLTDRVKIHMVDQHELLV